MTSKRAGFSLISILIIATFLRLYHFSSYTGGTGQASLPPGLYPDEAMNGNNALEALRTGDYKVYYPENNGREGLFIGIQAQFLRLLLPANGNQPEPWMLRLPSSLFGIMTVLGLYFLGRELVSKRVGLLAAFFLATSFWHINFSRIGFRAIMAPLLLTWSLCFLLASLNQTRRNSKSQAPNPKWSLVIGHWSFPILGGLVYGLGFYTYIAYRVSPLLMLFILFYFWRTSKKESWQKQFLRVTAYFLLAAFLVALPIGIYYLQHPADFLGRTAQVSVFSSPAPLHDLGMNIVKTLGMFNVAGDYNWRHNYAGRPELFWPVGILFIIGIAIGIKSLLVTKYERSTNIRNTTESTIRTFVQNSYFVANQKLGFIILFLWMFLAALPVVISNEGIPHALRSILLIPPAMMLAAIGGVYVYEWALEKTKTGTHARKILFATCYLLLTLFIFESYHTYFVLWGNDPNVQGAFAADYVAVGRTLNALPVNVLKYVVVPEGGVLVRGIPMPAQTVMFMTDTFLPEGQRQKNIFYVIPKNEDTIPPGAMIFHLQ